MKKGKRKLKEKRSIGRIILYGVGILFILLILYSFTFILWRPFDNVITQDRPVMKKLCEMQERCVIGKGDYRCSYKGQVSKDSESRLNKWDGYKGCNESTKGYGTKGDRGYIYIESCRCGGLM